MTTRFCLGSAIMISTNNMKTILASGSPTRRSILENIGIDFDVIPADIDEENLAKLSLTELVCDLAQKKAQHVYTKFEQENDFIILGFDSLVGLGDEIIGKLTTKKQAFEMFQKYRGKKLTMISGISIIGRHSTSAKDSVDRRGKFFENTDYEISYLHFKKDITNCQLNDFLDFNDWQGKAGGICVEGASSFLIEKVTGGWNNIRGIPMLKMNQMILETLGRPSIKVFEKK